MTEKKRRFHRRITKKYLRKGGSKNFYCRDIVRAYKNKVIYLGVDLNWLELFPSFSYDLSFAPVAGAVAPSGPGASPVAGPGEIKFIIPSSAASPAKIVFDMTKPTDFLEIDQAIENYLTLDVSNKWNDDNDKTSNNFKYILNNIMLPRYGNDIKTQIGEISSSFLNWNKNHIEDEQKNVIVKDNVNEKSIMILIHDKLLDFKLKMKKVLTNVFKQRVRKNIEIMMDMIEPSTPINIRRTCTFSVSGKIYFGIKVACNSYMNFELHELIIPDPVIPAMDDLPSKENFPEFREAVIKKFISQKEEKIQVYMEDLDGLLLFGSTPSEVGKPNRKGRKGNYGKHNISFAAHTGFDGTDKNKNPDYNPEADNIFEILRKN